ncbi:hypothetical protein CONPUDRAFT_89371 [Coniophora puteana RWD-64-598 SS2]|uniref:Uncharacterized protein n=1 Tax=Coniophora puteana (strain RWD-64-598) TaxID=741705 RepID=A0A5M3MR41_CONPW|nr:uncharacterized protein CONPUDRAFT_89371 [Coniophora puteana RWD-64-598 SS2]EIW81658.1 hypothetical protein CONPUDRAFT_89371 [Coniophora puteana RWD-64-598 SS2]
MGGECRRKCQPDRALCGRLKDKLPRGKPSFRGSPPPALILLSSSHQGHVASARSLHQPARTAIRGM